MNLPWYLGNPPHNVQILSWGILPLTLWSIIWKGLALWHAARRSEKWWFAALLVINTLGLLEILYLLFVVRIGQTAVPEKPQKAARKRSSQKE